jgi:hypothetical protein
VFRSGCGKIAPTVKIVRQKVVRLIGRNNMGVAGVNESERAARRADVDRLPEAVQHQDLTVE